MVDQGSCIFCWLIPDTNYTNALTHPLLLLKIQKSFLHQHSPFVKHKEYQLRIPLLSINKMWWKWFKTIIINILSSHHPSYQQDEDEGRILRSEISPLGQRWQCVFSPVAAALIKLRHFNVEFDEGWGGEMKGLLFRAHSDVLCVSMLWGSMMSFACKLWWLCMCKSYILTDG